MAGPAVGRSRTGRPGEIEIAAYACRRSPGASADAGSIPAASIFLGRCANVRLVISWGRLRSVAEGIRASRLLAFRPSPFRQAAHGFVDARAGLFDLLHVEPP